MRGGPHPAVLAWVAAQPPRADLHDVRQLGGILYGIGALPEGRRRSALATAAKAMFAEDFAERILPFEAAAAARYPRNRIDQFRDRACPSRRDRRFRTMARGQRVRTAPSGSRSAGSRRNGSSAGCPSLRRTPSHIRCAASSGSSRDRARASTAACSLRRIDRCAGRISRIIAFQTGDDPHRRLVVMVGQVLVRRHLPQLLRLIRSGGRRAVAIAGPDDFVEQLFVIALHDFLAGMVFQHQKTPALSVAAIGSRLAGEQDLADQLVGPGSGFSRRIARIVCMISKMSVVSAVPSGNSILHDSPRN